MKIAQVAPLFESVPPKLYGGTERVVSHLTEALVRQGHDVTLYASGDSRTSARLRPVTPRSLRLDPDCRDTLPHQVIQIEMIAAEAHLYDVVHFHIDLMQFPLFRLLRRPRLTTLHGRLDLPDLYPFYRVFHSEPVASISDAQREPLPHAGWIGTVYHGLPLDLLRPAGGPRDYLAFLGRISPEKRPDWAIRIAAAAGMKLKIAAKVDKVDQDYFAREIEPLLTTSGVEFVGEIGEADKSAFLNGARALLFPVDWPEPFGLAMIEAMACGTPVVARRRGSTPEVIDDGVSGFLFEDFDEAVDAVRRVDALNPARVRAQFERRFSADRMARDYVELYERVMTRDRDLVEMA